MAAHKVTLYAREVKWCGKLYSGTGVRHDPLRIRGVVERRRPETVGELMQFLLAANWMRLSLRNMVEIISSLRALLGAEATEDLFSYVIRHIPGAENHWVDLLSRLRSAGGGAAESGEEVQVRVRCGCTGRRQLLFLEHG